MLKKSSEASVWGGVIETGVYVGMCDVCYDLGHILCKQRCAISLASNQAFPCFSTFHAKNREGLVDFADVML